MGHKTHAISSAIRKATLAAAAMAVRAKTIGVPTRSVSGLQREVKSVAKPLCSIAAIAATLAASPALAECSGNGCTGVRITGLYTYGGDSQGYAWITTSGTETNLGNCTPDSGIFIKVEGGTPKVDWLFAQLLTAYQTQETLSVRTMDGGGVCRVSYIFAQK